MEYFDVYNKYGEKTGAIIERKDAHKSGVRHRTVYLWILNQNNEILIQKRSASKEVNPNLWHVSVAGHICTQETVEDTLIRETREELGLDISHLMDEVTYLYTFAECSVLNGGEYIDNEIYDVFVLKSDFDITQVVMQEEEVQAIRYIKFDELKEMIISKDASFWIDKVGSKMLIVALEDFFALG